MVLSIRHLPSIAEDLPILNYSKQNWTNIVIPIKAEVLGKLLNQVGYDHHKTCELVKGFSQGFDIGYRGPVK